jgi:hypothetical protein
VTQKIPQEDFMQGLCKKLGQVTAIITLFAVIAVNAAPAKEKETLESDCAKCRDNANSLGNENHLQAVKEALERGKEIARNRQILAAAKEHKNRYTVFTFTMGGYFADDEWIQQIASPFSCDGNKLRFYYQEIADLIPMTAVPDIAKIPSLRSDVTFTQKGGCQFLANTKYDRVDTILVVDKKTNEALALGTYADFGIKPAVRFYEDEY